MTADIHTLAGAYALHALDDDERVLFEAHLAECPACDQEVRELEATAARLGGLLRELPPPDLKDRVLAQIDATRQLPPPGPPAPPLSVPLTSVALPTTPPAPATSPSPVVPVASRTSERLLRLLAPAAAVIAIAVVGLGVMVVNLNVRMGELEPGISETSPGEASVAALLGAHDLDIVTVGEAPQPSDAGADRSGASARVMVSPSLGAAVFLAAGMDPAPHEHAYSLWLVHTDGQLTPVALFDVDPDGTVTQHVEADLSTVEALGVTVEPEQGSLQPSTEPVMLVSLTD